MNVSPKAIKCLNLALNEAATEGEWNAAAIRFCAILRKSGVEASSVFDGESRKRKSQNRKSKTADENPIMPFGKFKGVAICELPDWYLDWCLDQDFIKEPLRTKIEQESKTRNSN